MPPTDRELMQQPLRTHWEGCEAVHPECKKPEQEPVALETVYETIIQWDEGGGKRSRRELARRIVALYTARREWVGLTDEEIDDEYFDNWSISRMRDFARAIEAKLKEKNT